MKKLITLVILVLTGLMIEVPYSMVQSYPYYPPPGETGAPGENTCQSCHSSFGLNTGLGKITVSINNTSNIYQADSAYTITVTDKDSTEKIYGFELTALNSSNRAAGTLAVINSSNTYFQTGDSPTRDYVSHHNATTNNTWTFNWTAPSSNDGNITFYAAGVAANDDGTDQGDEVYTTNLAITYLATTTGIYQPVSANKTLSVYPVPATNFLNLSLPIANPSPVTVILFDITGKQVYKWNFDVQPIGQFNHILYLNNLSLPNGLYVVSVGTTGNTRSQKILIQNTSL